LNVLTSEIKQSILASELIFNLLRETAGDGRTLQERSATAIAAISMLTQRNTPYFNIYRFFAKNFSDYLHISLILCNFVPFFIVY
jgi:hypothetical protein